VLQRWQARTPFPSVSTVEKHIATGSIWVSR
jgi:hypothetical protein